MRIALLSNVTTDLLVDKIKPMADIYIRRGLMSGNRRLLIVLPVYMLINRKLLYCCYMLMPMLIYGMTEKMVVALLKNGQV